MCRDPPWGIPSGGHEKAIEKGSGPETSGSNLDGTQRPLPLQDVPLRQIGILDGGDGEGTDGTLTDEVEACLDLLRTPTGISSWFVDCEDEFNLSVSLPFDNNRQRSQDEEK